MNIYSVIFSCYSFFGTDIYGCWMDVTGKRGNCMKRYGYVHSSHAVADQGILLQGWGGWVPRSWKGGVNNLSFGQLCPKTHENEKIHVT